MLAPDQMLSNLIADVNAMEFAQGGSVLGNVLLHSKSQMPGGLNAACNGLNAFVNQAQAQTGKKLTAQQAAQLIASAQQVGAALGCR